MDTRILVTYFSRHGATAEAAARIGEVVAASGVPVDVAPMADVTGLDGYRAVVVGAPLYSANWPPEATGFVRKHSRALLMRPVACFVLAIRLRTDTEALRQAVLSAVSTERVMMKPRTVGLFAGALDYARLSPIVRLQAQTKGLPEGDFRNWAAIEAWAAGLPAVLLEG
jgi:menaquinone-dependent protoporphyrinogen oxidase